MYSTLICVHVIFQKYSHDLVETDHSQKLTPEFTCYYFIFYIHVGVFLLSPCNPVDHLLLLPQAPYLKWSPYHQGHCGL